MLNLLNGYSHIIISSICVYIFIVLAIRVFGKKELAQLSVVDLVFILLISNAVQNAMVGSDTSLVGGLIAAFSLFLINYIFKEIMYHFPKFSRLLQGEANMLIYNGRIIEKNMRRSKITNAELMEAIREHGVATIKEVNLAVLEVDGNISILSNEFKNKSSRKRRVHKTLSKSQSPN